MHIVLCMMEKLKKQLHNLCHNIKPVNKPDYHFASQIVASIVLEQLEEISIHDLWIAGVILRPGYRHFQFARSISTVSQWKQRGNLLIWKMINNLQITLLFSMNKIYNGILTTHFPTWK